VALVKLVGRVEHEFVAGDAYTIADMAIWPWYGGVVKGWLYEAAILSCVFVSKSLASWRS
jgi:GST-like protein